MVFFCFCFGEGVRGACGGIEIPKGPKMKPEGNEPGCRLSEPSEPGDTNSSVVRQLEHDLNFEE